MTRSESIHPRVFYGQDGQKLNTCRPRNRRRFERALAGIEKHLETHPRDAMSAVRAVALRTIIEGLPSAKAKQATA